MQSTPVPVSPCRIKQRKRTRNAVDVLVILDEMVLGPLGHGLEHVLGIPARNHRNMGLKRNLGHLPRHLKMNVDGNTGAA